VTNIRKPRNQNPTTSGRRFVASESERNRSLRGVLFVLLKFFRRTAPPIEGDLSEAILLLHGVPKDKTDSRDPKLYDNLIIPSANWISDILGPEVDTRKVRLMKIRAETLRQEAGPRIEKANEKGGNQEVEHYIRTAAIELLQIWGAPAEVGISTDLSVQGVRAALRAFRATVFCLDLYNIHPLVLITRASKGDVEAVLALIKVDKMFVHDNYTRSVIKDAESRNNRAFINQMARAMEYQPRLTRRGARHSYFTILFFLADLGIALPTLHELWRILDPIGREYESLSAFERDFQRRRIDFNHVIEGLVAEFPPCRVCD
jgi:hypothetical protein